MKKSAFWILVLSAGVFAATFGFAEDDYGTQPSRGDRKMGPPPSSMVATMDGSILVLTGNKLTKYDSNLEVVKEVEVGGGMGSQQGMRNPRRMEDAPMAPVPAEPALETPQPTDIAPPADLPPPSDMPPPSDAENNAPPQDKAE